MRRRPFDTTMEIPDDPVWGPLEVVARLSRESTGLPSFREGEFMSMGTVHDGSKQLRIHLYKHVDTRRYLNLDDAGHAYEYCGSSPSDLTGGRYRLHASLADAIENIELELFEEPHFFRSFPPDQWPASDAF